MLQIKVKHAQSLQQAKDEDEKKIEQDFQKEIAEGLLNVVWRTTVIDITITIHEACQMVFFDKSMDKNTRKKRGEGVRALREVFLAVPAPEGESEDHDYWAQAAFNAALETVKHKEETAFKAPHPPEMQWRKSTSSLWRRSIRPAGKWLLWSSDS